MGWVRFTWNDGRGFSVLKVEQHWRVEQGGVQQQLTVLSRWAGRVASILIFSFFAMKISVSTDHTRKTHSNKSVSSWFSKGLWQWLIHYRDTMLDMVHCMRYDINDVSEAGCTPAFRWLVSIPTVVTDNTKSVSMKTRVELTPETSCTSHLGQWAVFNIVFL
jgi:hypothetical protein